MPEQVGKIICMRNRFPGPEWMWVNTVGEGLRKHINLCFACASFRPNSPEHCVIAQQFFEFSKANFVAGPLVRCAAFVASTGVETQQSGGPA